MSLSPWRRLLLTAAVSLFLPGCTGLAASLIGGALGGGDGSLFSADDDPELVREAVPFGLKTMEALISSAPDDEELLLSAASGFTQYAYAFVQQDAERLDEVDPEASRAGLARARKLYRRARDYGLRALAAEWDDDFRARLDSDRAALLAEIDDEDAVPYLYWTAAPWAALIALSKVDMNAVGDLPAVEALVARGLQLDPDWGDGALRELAINLELASGSHDRARLHYQRVLELTGGKKVGPHVTWAESVAVQQQDRKLFDELLDKALAFDADEAPQYRLVNLIAQSRARWLKSRAGDLFLEE
jgi:predicted anti-sigma-YlaC factor YlaD